MMKKRDFLNLASVTFAACLWPGAADAKEAAPGTAQPASLPLPGIPAREQSTEVVLAAAWRNSSGASGDFVGLLQADWAVGQVQVKAAVAVPSRAHGLLAQAEGGFVAVASRPGKWLLSCDAGGQVVQWHKMESEAEGRTLDGHLCASLDGEWLYTTETDPLSGQGWVSVRERHSLRKVAQWRTHGAEPHQLLLDDTGALMVANGGILRAEGDKKRDLHLMDSSLVRLHPVTGERLGQWRLKDQRLGMRHLAWNQLDGEPGGGKRLLGIALQNEHDDLMQRRNSPVLAVWDGESLTTPTLVSAGGGYSGDIVAGPQGGFVLSCQRANMAVQWSPEAPADLVAVANLQEVGALAPWAPVAQSQSVLLAAARGLGRWHPTRAPALLKWPAAMTVDNHWAVL